MKTKIYLIVLAIFTIALFTSCQKEELDTREVATLTDATDLSSLKSVSPASAKRGKGEVHYVTIEFPNNGENMLSGGPYPARGKLNKLGVQTKYCESIDFIGLTDLPGSEKCFETQLLPTPPDDCDNLTTLTISKGRDGYLYMGYWFQGFGENGTTGPIDYQIYFRGGDNVFTSDDYDWPPAIGQEPVIFTFTSLDLVTKGGKNKNQACTGSWENVTHTVSVEYLSKAGFENWPPE